MSTITTSDGTEIFYKDRGQGQPIGKCPIELEFADLCGSLGAST